MELEDKSKRCKWRRRCSVGKAGRLRWESRWRKRTIFCNNYCTTSSWTCSCYLKMGQSHRITRYFIIHPLILITEWNVQLIAPKQSESALTCLRNHSHPHHTFPSVLPKSSRAFTSEKDELRQRKCGWKLEVLYGNIIGCPKRSINLSWQQCSRAPAPEMRQRQQPGVSTEGRINCKSITQQRCEMQNTEKGSKSCPSWGEPSSPWGQGRKTKNQSNTVLTVKQKSSL